MVTPQKPVPLLLRPLIALAERIAGRRLEPARVLSRNPRIALVSGMMESGVERAARRLGKRTAALVRIQTSFSVNCPFCIDMNLADTAAAGVGEAEVKALRSGRPDEAESFSARERLLLRYTAAIGDAPLALEPDLISAMEREWGFDATVRIAALAAKVNYWARLIQALGIPPAGFLVAWEPPKERE